MMIRFFAINAAEKFLSAQLAADPVRGSAVFLTAARWLNRVLQMQPVQAEQTLL
jgi:hypothetical protein